MKQIPFAQTFGPATFLTLIEDSTLRLDYVTNSSFLPAGLHYGVEFYNDFVDCAYFATLNEALEYILNNVR